MQGDSITANQEDHNLCDDAGEFSQLTFLPFWVFLAFLFGQFFLALIPTWSDGTYYDYGFLIPPIAVMMFSSRWSTIISKGREQEVAFEIQKCLRSLPLLMLVGISLILITGFRLVQSIDSGWRAPLYLHWIVVWIVSGSLLFRILPKGSAVSFFPLVLLTFLGIPLPSSIEFSLIQSLTDEVVEVAVAINRFNGFPLDVSGQTIFANGIPLQVSEGCSGIRSFQSSVFAGFVVGEMLRLNWPVRIVLIVFGALIAFVGNSCRVIFLVHHAFKHGDADLQKLHDISGYVSLTFTLIAILAAGYVFDRIAERFSRAGS